jgi:hypothetical protein
VSVQEVPIVTKTSDLKAGFPLANFFARSDLFPLSASNLPRLADVISDNDRGKRSLRARKFASGKPALIRDCHNLSGGGGGEV